MDDDTQELGGHIELSGFKDIDTASMIILKKIVGNHARKMTDQDLGFEGLHITMKAVHAKEKSEKYELHVKALVKSKAYTATVVDRNLFVATDDALKKVIRQIS